jgi:hypothetical protein
VRGLTNNDPVTTWFDKSGLQNHVTQSGEASLKPTYLTNRQNGLPGILFDGADYLINHAVAAFFTGEDKPSSAIAILSRANTAAWMNVACCGHTSSTTRVMLLHGYFNTPEAFHWRTDDLGVYKYPKGSSSTGFRIDSFCSSGIVGSLWNNGSKTLDEGDLNVGAITLDTFCVGSSVGSSMSSSYFNGVLCELLLYKSNLSNADRVLIQNYLSAKWGIVLA